MEHIIIIPSLNPDAKLIPLVDELTYMGAGRVVVVNDGSGKEYEEIFSRLGRYENVSVITHPENMGKGAALKTAFSYCLQHFGDMGGVITADGDGQHTAEDIMRISEAMSQDPNSLILGVRAFDKSSTPLRSYFGNRTTNRIFNALFHADLIDTQTGLRGIPASELEWMCGIRGRRYDYELNMLIQARRRDVNIKQVPVEIKYFDNNQGSHFRTLSDSLLVIRIMLYNLFINTGRKERFYGGLFYFCRGIMRVFHRRYAVVGGVPTKPAIIIGHHQNLKGGVRIMMWLNTNAHPWMLWVFCDKKECFRQYYGYTFTKRYGWNKAFAYIAARISAWFIPKLAASMRAIPVYRKSFKDISVTVSRSVEALCKNENLLIFPDIDYASDADAVGEMYTGFLNLDKYYYKKTGRHVDFVPIRVDTAARRLCFGKPSRIRDDEKYAEAKKRIGEELRGELNKR